MSGYAQLVEEGPYPFQTTDDVGTRYAPPAPCPALEVTGATLTAVTQLFVQLLGCRTTDGVPIIVQRLVARLETGAELELQRTVHAVHAAAPGPAADPTVCGACGRPLPRSGGLLIEGVLYHYGCVR